MRAMGRRDGGSEKESWTGVGVAVFSLFNLTRKHGKSLWSREVPGELARTMFVWVRETKPQKDIDRAPYF